MKRPFWMRDEEEYGEERPPRGDANPNRLYPLYVGLAILWVVILAVILYRHQ